jgi:MOSC domain-containing protein YiiM
MAGILPRVLSVNVGSIRTIEWRGRMVTTGIWKHPASGRVALRGVNFIGDDQADRSVHGGPDKAVYAYAREDYDYWRNVEGVETSPGLFGDNLTTAGLDLSNAIIGERWTVGSTVLEIAQPRLPCYKLGIRLNDAHFPKRFMSVNRMGAYLRVVVEGDVGANDEVRVSDTPSHGVSLGDMVQALRNPLKAAALRVVKRLPEFWRQVADET